MTAGAGRVGEADRAGGPADPNPQAVSALAGAHPSRDETARLLNRAAERRNRADQLMTEGLRAAERADASSIAHAAACFTVAAALRGEARFIP